MHFHFIYTLTADLKQHNRVGLHLKPRNFFLFYLVVFHYRNSRRERVILRLVS